ncbi:MAG: tyrosine-type recombinase/integrase [Burkholderiales bacterium]
MATSNSLPRLVQSWRLALLAERKSPRTIEGYAETLRLFERWCDAQGTSTTVDEITADQIRAYLADHLERNTASTAQTRYKGLRVFFGWCVDEGELAVSPIGNIKPPHIPEQPVPILTDDESGRLIKTLEADKTFEGLRDLAIVRLFIDSGMRRAELAGLRMVDIDVHGNQVATVLGKGGRHRACPFGAKTAKALDRYLRERERHALKVSPMFWLSARSDFSGQEIRQMLERRGARAEIVNLHAHRFRHTFAHGWLA